MRPAAAFPFPVPVVLVLAAAGCGPVREGDRAWSRGDAEATVAAWSPVQDSLDPPRQQRLARALAGTGRVEEAQVLLAELPRERWTPDGWMAEGLSQLAGGHPAEAAEAFAAGLARGTDPALRINLCAALLAAGTPDATACSEALVAAPEDPAAQLGLGAASLLEGNTVVARRVLSGLLVNPAARPAQVWEAAQILVSLGAGREACQAVMGVEGTPLDRGRLCAAAGDEDAARRVLEPVVEAEPEASFILGTLALDRALSAPVGAERERAVADAGRRFRACGAAMSGDADWWNNTGRLHALDGAGDEAEQAFRRALALSPGAPFPALNLARLLASRGRTEEARTLLEGLADRSPGGAEGAVPLVAGLDLARMLARQGAGGEAAARAEVVRQRCTAGGLSECAVEAGLLLAGLRAQGDPEGTLLLLAEVVAAGGPAVQARLAVEPDLEALRQDPRFASLLGAEGM